MSRPEGEVHDKYHPMKCYFERTIGQINAVKPAYGLIGLTLTGHFGGIWAGCSAKIRGQSRQPRLCERLYLKRLFSAPPNPNPLVLKVEAAQNDYRRQNIGFYCGFL